ncbi:MAG TPA: MFS transporter [Clostridia bacterium]|nr:MFS transporter [Clostridia bacterium]
MSNALSEKDYKISKKMFLVEGMSGTVALNLVNGAFISGFAHLLGASVSLNGIFGALPILGAMAQFVSPFIFERKQRRKKTVLTLLTICRLSISLAFFLPLLFGSPLIRLISFAGLVAIGYMSVNMGIPAISNWLLNVVGKDSLGSYLGTKEALSYLALGIFGAFMGVMLDYFKTAGNEAGGYIVNAVVIFLFSIINIASLVIAREPVSHANASRIRMRDVFIEPIRNPRFRKVLALNCIWNTGYWIAAPFFFAYIITGLRLPYIFILGTVFLQNFTRFLTAKRWGRLADKISFEFVIKIGYIIMCLSHFLWIFVNASNAYVLVTLNNMITGTGFGAVQISMYNIQYSYAPSKFKTAYLSANGAIGGGVGFISTLIGSWMVASLSVDGTVFGLTFTPLQVVFLISSFVLGLTALYVHFKLQQKNVDAG